MMVLSTPSHAGPMCLRGTVSVSASLADTSLLSWSLATRALPLSQTTSLFS